MIERGKKKRQQLFVLTNKKSAILPRNQKILIKKKIVDKIHKLIVKELKFNVNCHIKIGRNHNLL
jgi:hypothetical protein